MDPNSFCARPFVVLWNKVCPSRAIALKPKEKRASRSLSTENESPDIDIGVEDGSVVADFFKSIGDWFGSSGPDTLDSSGGFLDFLDSGNNDSGGDMSGPD